MSEATPTYVLQQIVASPEIGLVVDSRDYRTYMKDLNGWFMWRGEMYDLKGKSLGAGLTRITAEVHQFKHEAIKS